MMDKHVLPPADIATLMVLHYKPGPRVNGAAVRRLHDRGLIDCSQCDQTSYGSAVEFACPPPLTERGEKMLQMLCETPLPERIEEWCDPREAQS